jgi:truncated hemoglobin YjbI
MTAGPRPDITGRDDIADLVTAFYQRAFTDDILGPVFVDVAAMDLPAHLPVMCDFWETVLFRAGRYRRNALPLCQDQMRQDLILKHCAEGERGVRSPREFD